MNTPEQIVVKAERAIIKVMGESNVVHEVVGWNIAGAVLGAILGATGKYEVILLFNGRKLIDFDSLGECTEFAFVLLNKEHVFLANADMEQLFARNGGREEFIKSVQKSIDEVRKCSQ